MEKNLKRIDTCMCITIHFAVYLKLTSNTTLLIKYTLIYKFLKALVFPPHVLGWVQRRH